MTEKMGEILRQMSTLMCMLAEEIENENNTPKSKSEHITKADEKELEMKVSDILQKIGVSANIKGYYYVRSAIIMSMENKDMLSAVTKELYPKIAEKYNTTWSRVERAIRHAIENAWKKENYEVIDYYFKGTIKKGYKPTNFEFIATLSDKLKMELK